MNKEEWLNMMIVLMFTVYELIICVTLCTTGNELTVSGNK